MLLRKNVTELRRYDTYILNDGKSLFSRMLKINNRTALLSFIRINTIITIYSYSKNILN